MTAIKMIVLACDGFDCESEASEGAWFTTVPEALEHARKAKWIRVTRQGKAYDLCPLCTQPDYRARADGSIRRPLLDAIPRRSIS